MEFTLLFAVITSGACAYLAVRLLSSRLAGIDRPLDTLLGAAGLGLVTGRVAAMIGDGVNPLTNPFQIVLVRAGVDTAVAASAAVGALLWFWRRSLPRPVDAVAPVAVAGLAGWHGGCVWRGTCLGTVSELPWAYGLSGSSVTRHPVELYAALGMLVTAVIVARLPPAPWLAAGVSIVGVAATRVITEPLRPSLTGGPVGFYVSAIVIGLLVVAFRRSLPAVAIDRRPADLTDPL